MMLAPQDWFLALQVTDKVGSYIHLSNSSSNFKDEVKITSVLENSWMSSYEIDNFQYLLFENDDGISIYDPSTNQISSFMDFGNHYKEYSISKNYTYLTRAIDNQIEIFNIVNNEFLEPIVEETDILNATISHDEQFIAYMTKDAAFVRKLSNLDLVGYIPSEMVAVNYVRYISVNVFRMISSISLFFTFGCLEVIIIYSNHRRKIEEAKFLSSNLYLET